MAVELKFTEENVGKISAALLSTISKEHMANYWKIVASKIDQQTKLAFKVSGARAGHEKWPPLSPDTVRTPAGTWKLRYGTDKRPARTAAELADYKKKIHWGWGVRGPMKGYTAKTYRRYNAASKPLLASGEFMRSFGIQELTPDRLRYGTVFEGGANKRRVSAEKIMSVGPRPVLFVMPQDEVEFRNAWFQHMRNQVKNMAVK